MRKFLNIIILSLFLYSCQASKAGPFGRGVSISFDPRTVGMQIADTLMLNNLIAGLSFTD